MKRSVLLIIIFLSFQFIAFSLDLTFRIEQHAPDMILIPGDKDTPSFYISRYEVRNRDYMVYTEWLKRTYQSYPEVYKSALPDTVNYPNYFVNPAYRNFPVLGVSYKQANEYCHWLTDRFNEYLMIKNGLLMKDMGQINERNFNTLSYLEGQYIGLIAKDLMSTHSVSGGRSAIWYDKLMIPSFRLPSKNEWNHLIETIDINQEKLDYKKLKCKRPYGRRYFLDLFYEQYIVNEHWSGEYPLKYHLSNDDEEDYFNMIYPVCEESSGSPFLGIGNSVGEWVSDSYSEELSYSQKLEKKVISFEKDHLGRAPYIIFKDDEKGKPLFVDRKLPNTSFSLVDSETSHNGFRVALSVLNKPKYQTFGKLKEALENPDEVMVLYLMRFYPEPSLDLSVFKNMVDFSMAEYSLETAPKGLEKAVSLQKCRLPFNNLESIPDELFKLPNLQFLDLSYNQITTIPADIHKLENLVELRLANNKITHLPKDINLLENLEEIDLSNNRLKSLPESFAKLSKLKRLDLSGNSLSDISEIITRLPNLKYLKIGDNNISEQEKNLLINWITSNGGILRSGNQWFHSSERYIIYRND